MKRKIICNWFLLFPFLLNAQLSKAPAYPLIVHDPYFSIWSFTDKLNESVTKHWTGTEQSFIGMIQVDGTFYDFLGKPKLPTQTLMDSGLVKSEMVKGLQKAIQKNVTMTATQTKYEFECGGFFFPLILFLHY